MTVEGRVQSKEPLPRHVVDHGMSRPNSAAVRRACEYYNPMRMSLWEFGWFVISSAIKRAQKLLLKSFIENELQVILAL